MDPSPLCVCIDPPNGGSVCERRISAKYGVDCIHTNGMPVDSIIQLLYRKAGAPVGERLKADNFRELVDYDHELKEKLAGLRSSKSPEEVDSIKQRILRLSQAPLPMWLDLYLTYRAAYDWQGMISLYEILPAPLQRSVMVRELLAMAKNRVVKGSEEAEQILKDILDATGPDSETCGILGRVFKSRSAAATNEFDAADALDEAIKYYTMGFKADPRDFFPGINALTLMDESGEYEAQMAEILPVVKYAVKRVLSRTSKPSYWDMATLLELAALEGNSKEAQACVARMLKTEWESWNPETTADNLRRIKKTRQARLKRRQWWLEKIIRHLDQSAQEAANRWWAFTASPPSTNLVLKLSMVRGSDPPRIRCRYRLDTPSKRGKEAGTQFELLWSVEELAALKHAFRNPYEEYDPARIKLYGSRLRQAIGNSTKLDRAFRDLLDNDGERRLVIQDLVPQIAQIIFEALPLTVQQVQAPFVALAGNAVVRRIAEGDRRPRPGTPTDDGTLLFAWSQPRRKEDERRIVPHARHGRVLRKICKRNGIEMVTVPNASLEKIRNAARKAQENGKPVRALHLLCHGAEVGAVWGLEIDASHKGAVDPTQLNALLHNDLPHLALLTLHACNSADPGSDTEDNLMNLLGSVADSSYAAGADVVACQVPFTFNGSIIAVREIYSQLLSERRSLAQAVQATVAKLYKDPPHNYHDWAAMVLMEHQG